MNSSFLSLTKREADVAVRPSNRPPENLVGRRVGMIQTALYASRTYPREHGQKKDWTQYDWIAPDEALAHLAQAKWVRERIPEERIVARVDSLLGMFAAVRHGLGVGLLLCLLGDQETDLVQLAAPGKDLDTQLWVLTHPDLRNVARIKAFTEHLYGQLSRSAFVVRSAPSDRGSSQRSKRR